MRARHRLLFALAVPGVLLVAACGSKTDVRVSVIRGWAGALRAGRIDQAASYFALPAIVENGTPPVRITTRAQIRDFNKLLPCGARLVRSTRHGAYIFATFRLTDRVGGACGSGSGLLAATAFLIRGGKIVEWRRLPDPGGPPRLPSSPTPVPAPGRNPAV